MVGEKPRVVVVGAGMAGLTAAYRLQTAAPDMFDICVVEAGDRIGGRIFTSEFAGDRVEMGATWIHGIGGSPIYEMADKIGALESDGRPWERMDGFPVDPVIIAEGGAHIDSELSSSISSLYTSLMETVSLGCVNESTGCKSVGEFVRRGLRAHQTTVKSNGRLLNGEELVIGWTKEKLEEAVFAIHENTERTYTSADDLDTLNLHTECEYREFPGEQITIARGYSRVIDQLAKALPAGAIKLRTKVRRIEWLCPPPGKPVRVIFDGGAALPADHVIITVSLGVLKAGLKGEDVDQGLVFDPQLPKTKAGAIGRLGFGLVNKLFMELEEQESTFPFMELAFDPTTSAGEGGAPWWMRRTASICPIYGGARVLLAWFAGRQAAALEAMEEKEIIRGVHATLDCFSSSPASLAEHDKPNGLPRCNGSSARRHGRIRRVKTSKWGSDPLFLGSYSYVAVGSSGDDLDLMAEPLPRKDDRAGDEVASVQSLQLLFGGEATHRTHYSTTHGAYFSGIREAERLIKRYRSSFYQPSEFFS